MNTLARLSLSWLLVASAAQAQFPSTVELAAAVRATVPQARRAGLALQEGALWHTALHHRTPLVAAHVQGTCHLGYSAYTPGRDYRWLFPALEPALRARWMAGVVHHELAHCAEQAEITPGTDKAASGAGLQGHRQQEVLADLAFALHVDAHQDADGAALVAHLAHLRASHAVQDPSHNTAAELRCYLQQRGQFRPAGAWLAQLQAWRQRCGGVDETNDRSAFVAH